MTGTHAVVNNLQALAKPLTTPSKSTGYSLLIFATNWGYTDNWDMVASKIKTVGI
jgi:hypothetical protein